MLSLSLTLTAEKRQAAEKEAPTSIGTLAKMSEGCVAARPDLRIGRARKTTTSSSSCAQLHSAADPAPSSGHTAACPLIRNPRRLSSREPRGSECKWRQCECENASVGFDCDHERPTATAKEKKKEKGGKPEAKCRHRLLLVIAALHAAFYTTRAHWLSTCAGNKAPSSSFARMDTPCPWPGPDSCSLPLPLSLRCACISVLRMGSSGPS